MVVPRDVSERLEKGKEGIIYIAPKYRDKSDCISGSVPIQSEVYLSTQTASGHTGSGNHGESHAPFSHRPIKCPPGE